MIKLGRDANGKVYYMTIEELQDAAKNRLAYKSKLNNQQYAKLRKILNRL